MPATKTTQDRQAGWFGTRTRPMHMHYTVAAGDGALCNKRYTPRNAPLNDGSGWGYELFTDEEIAAKRERYSFIELCPQCVAKKQALTCSTIGCKSPAEYKISYNFRGEEEISTDLACGPCADGYSRRPVLKNFRRIPLA